ncbi:hypothetical protein J2T13_004960 [Paenibacillus sp. DS2015]|uniref:hypothetical protein n=1 Tax=Paenibacillus sp. DS2015 TaxID=3373917 RepID=UPI003D20CD96
MAYQKTTWIDRLVQFPRRFTKTLEGANVVTLTPDPGTITELGTFVSAAVMNNMELGIENADAAATKARDDLVLANNALNLKAPLANPVFTGTPKVGSATMITADNIATYTPPVDTGNYIGGDMYVSTLGSDTTGTGQLAYPFKTIQKALNSAKKHLVTTLIINIKAGTYPEAITISNFDGARGITLQPHGSGLVIITSDVYVDACSMSSMYFYNLNFTGSITSRGDGGCRFMSVLGCTFTTNSSYGISFETAGVLSVLNSTFTGKPTCIRLVGSVLLSISSGNSGSGNAVGISVLSGAILTVRGNISIGAATTFQVETGGTVFNTPSGKIYV